MQHLMKYSTLISINLSVNNPEISYTLRGKYDWPFYSTIFGLIQRNGKILRNHRVKRRIKSGSTCLNLESYSPENSMNLGESH